MSFYQFKREQIINTSVDELWDFISTPKNLSRITPPEMEFEIINSEIPKKIYAGLIICYNVKPIFGIKTKWVTEITHLKEKSYFVDEQRVGPYAIWHHQHIISEENNGVLMQDIISYSPPMFFLGALANHLFIEKKLNQIFDYREKVINSFFVE